MFMNDGKEVLLSLLVKMIELQEETILKLKGHELLVFFKTVMPYICLTHYNMQILLD
jgi:hypothetical protein